MHKEYLHTGLDHRHKDLELHWYLLLLIQNLYRPQMWKCTCHRCIWKRLSHGRNFHWHKELPWHPGIQPQLYDSSPQCRGCSQWWASTALPSTSLLPSHRHWYWHMCSKCKPLPSESNQGCNHHLHRKWLETRSPPILPSSFAFSRLLSTWVV